MNNVERALKILEYDKIAERVKEHCSCTLGCEACISTKPTRDISLANLRQQQTKEAKYILQIESIVPFGGIFDIRSAVARTSVFGALQPSEFVSISSTLKGTSKLKSFILKQKAHSLSLSDIAADIEIFPTIEAEINRCISDGGEVLDSASQELGKIRSELKTIHSRLMEKLQNILHSSGNKTAIQEAVVTVRNDRYCIPVKSDHRGQIPGIIHDASSSGATVFIEPASVVEQGNKLKELAVREREEIDKILTKLSSRISEHSAEMLATLNVAAILDSIFARARFALELKASEPILNDKGRINIKAARHPLLGSNVVPINISLGIDFDALLITGPNTGGKTVCLKTVGLFCLMAASGMQIPATEGSELSVFSGIFADIGDEQSIEQSLSTFSAHLKNIVEISNNAKQGSLVLLDEIGAGTDPAEGAALGKALIDSLLRKGIKIIATTHYGELKEYAYLTDRVQNASVEFDALSLRPTYKLLIGIPGSSNAFDISERLGLDSEIVNTARKNLSHQSDTSDELIRRLEETHFKLEENRKIAEKDSEELTELKSIYEEELSKIDNLKDRIESKIRDRAASVIDEYSKMLDITLQELAQQPKDSIRSQALKQKSLKLLEELEEKVVERKPKLRPIVPIERNMLSVGKRVHITTLGQDAEIIEKPIDGKVAVMVGMMRMSVPISSLSKAKSEPKKTSDQPSVSKIAFEKAKNLHPEISLRGKRVEQAMFELEKYIDDAIAAGIQSVRIVHGKGTGVMREVVWKYLKAHPFVKNIRLGEDGEGGHGVSIATFK